MDKVALILKYTCVYIACENPFYFCVIDSSIYDAMLLFLGIHRHDAGL